jgi:hypothetical protein
MSEPIHIISLGAGVQSSAMALMAARGEITPMPKAAVGWTGWRSNCRFRFTEGDLFEDACRIRTSKTTGKFYTKHAIPAFIVSPDGKTAGLAMRQCECEGMCGV